MRDCPYCKGNLFILEKTEDGFQYVCYACSMCSSELSTIETNAMTYYDFKVVYTLARYVYGSNEIKIIISVDDEDVGALPDFVNGLFHGFNTESDHILFRGNRLSKEYSLDINMEAVSFNRLRLKTIK